MTESHGRKKEMDAFNKMLADIPKRNKYDKLLDRMPVLPHDQRTFKLEKDIKNGKSQKQKRAKKD